VIIDVARVGFKSKNELNQSDIDYQEKVRNENYPIT
jgi:hypothetical protein